MPMTDFISAWCSPDIKRSIEDGNEEILQIVANDISVTIITRHIRFLVIYKQFEGDDKFKLIQLGTAEIRAIKKAASALEH